MSAEKESTEREILLEAHALERRFGERLAVADVSLTLRRGEIVGFLGPNGAGKSTTLNMLSGTLAPTRGEIRIMGHDLAESPAAAKQALGYLPEIPPLYPEMTVREYLGFCAALHRVPRARIDAACKDAMKRCHLDAVADRLIGNLSKGFQQRVGIAQAIVHSPAVVILDEPTVGLDPNQILEIRELIRELGRTHAVLLSTHILPEVQAVCDRVLILHDGRLVHSQSIRQEEIAATRTMRLTATALPSTERLLALPGVSNAYRENDRTVKLQVDADFAPATLLEIAVAEQWQLQEFTAEQPSLEQLFIRLTSSDQGGMH